ncbi:PAS domain S-box protein [Leptolyngbya sp. AN03gr2]|uniref:PAS domain-containing hybrid sensor histidine kinase/response regulator n=1 Tax=unclassified Leptolyngbya TaxID=2650499 RepID=UPI003D3243AA
MIRPSLTLLLIENLTLDREQYRHYLLSDTNSNYQVLEAETAIAGLNLCRTHRIDGILLNYLLPDGNGLAFLESLHAQSNGSFPPVVMVTGQGDETIAVRAIKLGAEDYLVKRQLTPTLLRSTMRSAIENAKLRQQLRQSDDRFRVSIENMLDCFGIFSAVRDEAGQILDFRIDYLNAAALEANRMTRMAIGKGLCEMLPAHRETELFDDYCRVVETGTPLSKESLIYTDVYGQQQLARAFDIRASKLDDGFVASWRDVTEKKRSCQALEQQARLLEMVADAVIVRDRNSAIVSWNKAAEELYGWQREEAMGNVTHTFLQTQFPTQMDIDAILLQDGRWQGELTHTCKEGKRIIVESHQVLVRDPAGRPAGYLEVNRDITDRKRTEAALRERDRRFREIFNTTYQFVGLLTPDGIVLEANQTALDFAGLTREAVIGRPFCELRWWTISPQTQQQLQDAIRRAREGEFVRYEVEVLGAGEATTIIDFSLKPVRDESGQVVLLIPEGRDIHDRIRNEYDRIRDQQRLRESEARLQLGVQVAGVALARFNYATHTVELSPEAAVMYGLPSDQLVVSRDRIHATFHPEERETMEQIIAQVLDPAGDGWFEREHRVVWSNGEVRWLTVRRQVFFEEVNGAMRPSYAILAAIDVTDRKQAEAERDRLLAEAEAANRSKDEFVALVAHELRSPLNSILGWAKLLRTRSFDAATIAKALETIERNTNAQVQLVEDLLDMSRIASGKLSITLAPVSLAAVINTAIEMVQLQAQAKQIEISTQIALAPQISGDYNRLQQVAVNLLTNAIKFTPEGGRVEIGLTQVGTQVQLQVSDTGKGIAPEFLPRMFERFQQGQKNAGSKDGLGLGLAIVKNLVELHNGTITADSPGLEQGAIFTACFPMLSTPAIVQESVPHSINTASLAGIRVLVVDDEPDMLNLIAFVLEDYGAEVRSATHAAGAISLLSEFDPDILLSDIAMPGGSGYDLIKEIRRLEVVQHFAYQIPAIALTSFASTTYEERSLQAGFQRHLTKPVDPELLVRSILDHVRLKR